MTHGFFFSFFSSLLGVVTNIFFIDSRQDQRDVEVKTLYKEKQLNEAIFFFFSKIYVE